MLSSIKKYFFYRRYKWTAADFTQFQNMVFGLQQGMAEGLLQSGVMGGYDYDGATGLNVGVRAGSAMGPSGDLLVKAEVNILNIPPAASGTVKGLVVCRTVITDGDNIAQPTNPFNTVPKTRAYSAGLAVVQAAPNAGYPSKGVNDVVLFGVEVNGAAVVSTDLSKCELAGKNSELRRLKTYDMIVGNQRHCTHKTLVEAIAAASNGDRILVTEDQTLTATLTVNKSVEIVFKPGMGFTRSGSFTPGMLVTATNVSIKGGYIRGFDAGRVAITAHATSAGIIVGEATFENNATDVLDSAGTSAIYGCKTDD